MSFKYNVDEEIVAEKQTGPHNGYRYSHPSYAMINVCRYSGGDGHPLFGSEVSSSGGIRIQISEANVTQDLGRNWFFADNLIVEVEMSPVQYAEMISSPNTQGMPCTLKYVQGKGNIRYRPIETTTQYIESEVEQDVNELKRKTKQIRAQVNEILDQKGTLKKTDKEQVSNLVNELVQAITSDLPFYEKCLTESIERQKTEARVEIEAHVAHAITKAGINAINNPEAVKLLLDGRKEGEKE